MEQFPHPFAKVAKQYNELRRQLYTDVSMIAAAHFKQNFSRQGYLNNGAVVPWKARKIADAGKARALLIKSGRLRRGIRPAPTSSFARVVNTVPYAAAHNEGMVLNGRANVPQHRRRILEAQEVSRPGAKTEKWVKKQVGISQVSAHTRQMNTTIPARPFMITTPDLMHEFEEHVFSEIDKIWK